MVKESTVSSKNEDKNSLKARTEEESPSELPAQTTGETKEFANVGEQESAANPNSAPLSSPVQEEPGIRRPRPFSLTTIGDLARHQVRLENRTIQFPTETVLARQTVKRRRAWELETRGGQNPQQPPQRPGQFMPGSMMQQQPPGMGSHMNPNAGGPMQNRFPSSMQPPLGGGMAPMPGAAMIGQPNMRGGVSGPGQGLAAMQRPMGPGQGLNPPPYRATMGQPGGMQGYNQPGVQPQMPQGMGGNPLGNHQQGTAQDMQAYHAMMQQMNEQLEQSLRNTRTPEERTQLFNELKTTPHLFCAFLTMSRHQEGQQQFPATAMFAQSLMRDYAMQQGPPQAWQQQPQFQQRPQQGSPAMGGPPFNQMQGRSPSVGSPQGQMMQPPPGSPTSSAEPPLRSL